jgi:hypothetical protein
LALFVRIHCPLPPPLVAPSKYSNLAQPEQLEEEKAGTATAHLPNGMVEYVV